MRQPLRRPPPEFAYYLQYVAALGLGWRSSIRRRSLPAYAGSLALTTPGSPGGTTPSSTARRESAVTTGETDQP